MNLSYPSNGFWGGRFERTFFDVRVFNPTHRQTRGTNCYRKHELEKKWKYEQRERVVEHASFTPLVLSATGGMANQATVFRGRYVHSYEFVSASRRVLGDEVDEKHYLDGQNQ